MPVRGHGQENFPQKQEQAGDQGQHGEHEQAPDGVGQIGTDERAQEGPGDEQAHEQPRNDRKLDGEVDEADPAGNDSQFFARRLQLRFRHRRKLFLEIAPPVDRAAEADVERCDDRANRGQQENRRDCKLMTPEISGTCASKAMNQSIAKK